MKPLPYNADLLKLAPRVIWFEPAETAPADPVRFLTYLMTYGTIDEIRLVKRYVDLNDFREALEHAPPGVMDERSWAYWNIKLGRYPVPPNAAAEFWSVAKPSTFCRISNFLQLSTAGSGARPRSLKLQR